MIQASKFENRVQSHIDSNLFRFARESGLTQLQKRLKESVLKESILKESILKESILKSILKCSGEHLPGENKQLRTLAEIGILMPLKDASILKDGQTFGVFGDLSEGEETQ